MTFRGVVDNCVQVLLPVLNKMSAPALCRFRQVSKRMDNFVELHRHEITAIHEVEMTIEEHFVCGPYHSFHVNVNQVEDRKSRRDLYDPYKQLSAINFRKIIVEIMFESDIDYDSFIATMKKWRLRCETLDIKELPWEDDHDVILTHTLATKKVFVRRPLIKLSELHKWPIKNLDCEFRIEELESLGANVKDYRSILIQPEREIHEVTNWLNEFLSAVEKDRKARGSLEHLAIRCNFTPGYIFNFPILLDIKKVIIDGGFALAINRFSATDLDTMNIFFIKNDNRESLFEAILSYDERYNQELDVANKKDDFLNAKNDLTAFALVFPTLPEQP